MISVCFQGKPFSIKIIQVYALTTNVKEAGFYEDLQDLLELTPKRCPFHHRGLKWKRRKSRDTWSNRQVWPWSIKWSKTKSNRVLPRECTGHNKHPLPTTQEMTLHMDINRWSLSNQIDYILYCLRQRWRSSIQSAKTRSTADCGSDHDLLIANSGLNWRK